MMRKLTIFNFITINGFYKGTSGDISWHQHGGEENDFSVESLSSGNILLFGRVTYEMMAGYWTTPVAFENFPEVAAGMNKSEKIVFSNSMKKTEWQNSKVMSGDIVEEIRRIKNTRGKDLTILGSGSIVTQFAEAGLIDEYQIMVDPVAIGEGTPIFNGLKNQLRLKLTGTRAFKSGVVLLSFEKS